MHREAGHGAGDRSRGEVGCIKDENGQRFCLERKEIFESETRKIQGARRTLEQLILTLESSAVNLDAVKAMQSGVAAMRSMSMGVEMVDALMAEITEGVGNAAEFLTFEAQVKQNLQIATSVDMLQIINTLGSICDTLKERRVCTTSHCCPTPLY
jgi:hypothetical protein